MRKALYLHNDSLSKGRSLTQRVSDNLAVRKEDCLISSFFFTSGKHILLNLMTGILLLNQLSSKLDNKKRNPVLEIVCELFKFPSIWKERSLTTRMILTTQLLTLRNTRLKLIQRLFVILDRDQSIVDIKNIKMDISYF